MSARTATLPPIVRVMRRLVYDVDGCLLWPGALSSDGYGFVSVGSPLDGTETTVRVHVVTYEHYVGLVPDGMTLDHACHSRAVLLGTCVGGECRHRRCANPLHAEPVTIRENLLRGDTPAARNLAKTHCPQGHPYDADNTSPKRSGRSRSCRACARAYWHRTKGADRAATR